MQGLRITGGATCTLLYLSKRVPEIQSTVRWLCKWLINPTVKAGRQLIKLLCYLKGSSHLATYFPEHGVVDRIEGFLDGDWACDELDRKSVSGAAVMVAGCRMHSHSRTTPTHALSSGESAIVSLSEVLKECLLIQYNLEFVGVGRLPIQLLTDATVARQFVHRKGVGRVKHLEARYVWLQQHLAEGAYAIKKLPSNENASDMMTHLPSAPELQKFLRVIGIFPMERSRGAVEIVKTALSQRPSSGVRLASVMLAALAGTGNAQAIAGAPERWTLSLGAAEIGAIVCFTVMVIFLTSRWMTFGNPQPRLLPASSRKGDLCLERRSADKAIQVNLEGSLSVGSGRLYVAPTGECFHTDPRCRGLDKARQVTSRRPCTLCT